MNLAQFRKLRNIGLVISLAALLSSLMLLGITRNLEMATNPLYWAFTGYFGLLAFILWKIK